VRARADGIRIGVVGVGYWGSRHVRVLRSTTGVAAVIGVDERFASIGDGRREPEDGLTAFADIEDALPEVDAVVIATPPTSHAPLAMKAIAAGKHVLVEKPMAITTNAARTLVEAAAAAGVVLMPGHTFEHNAAVQKLRDLVRGGHLGRVFYLDCARLNLGLYQSDVNVIFDLAPHDISISNFVLGARPTTVTVWGSRHVHPEYEDVAYLRLDYGDLGVRSNIHVSWLDPRKVRRVTAAGSKKMVVYDDMADGERIRVYDKAAIPPDGSVPPGRRGVAIRPVLRAAGGSGSALRRLHHQQLGPLRGREQRPGRRPDPGVRPDLAAGAAARGPCRGSAAAQRHAGRTRRGLRQDFQWLTRQRSRLPV
jgi:predicted dehydrogenase